MDRGRRARRSTEQCADRLVCRDDDFCPKLEDRSLVWVAFDDLDTLAGVLTVSIFEISLGVELLESSETVSRTLDDLVYQVFDQSEIAIGDL